MQPMEITWRTVNGIEKGEVIKTHTTYLVRLGNGKDMVVDGRCVIDIHGEPEPEGDEISLF